jgi:hypothetical protein
VSAHAHHEAQPRYSPAQVLHDGCTECCYRASCRDHGIASLDPAAFARAWRRAADWNRMGGGLDDVADAEVPLLSVLWPVQLQLEAVGWPIGELPASPVEALLDTLRQQLGPFCGQCGGMLPGHQLTCPLIPAGPEHPAGPLATTPAGMRKLLEERS